MQKIDLIGCDVLVISGRHEGKTGCVLASLERDGREVLEIVFDETIKLNEERTDGDPNQNKEGGILWYDDDIDYVEPDQCQLVEVLGSQ